MIDEYFATLEDWKKLPAYKLETRIDSLVGFALPRVLESMHGLQTRIIVPELPLRLGTVNPKLADKSYADRSYKVDFYIRTKCGRNLFIEFKSDSGSRRQKQDDYLQCASNLKMDQVLGGILQIAGVSTFKEKYGHLLGKLRQASLIDETKPLVGPEDIRVMYVQPKHLAGDSDKELILYPKLAAVIRSVFPGGELMERLALSLEKWAAD